MNEGMRKQLGNAWQVATRGVPLGTGYRPNEAGARRPRWQLYLQLIVAAGQIPDGIERADYLERFKSQP